jgi:multiple sugar transport system substrate-binding protein
MTQVTNVYQGFAEGFFAMYITGPWNIGEFSRRLPADMQDKWMTAPMPGPTAGEPGVSLAGGSSLVVFRASKHKDAAWKLIEYLAQSDVQFEFYKLTGDLPARRESWEYAELRDNRHIAAFHRQLGYVRSTPKIPEWERIAMKLQEVCEAVSIGKADVRTALNAFDGDVNRILEKRRWIVENAK